MITDWKLDLTDKLMWSDSIISENAFSVIINKLLMERKIIFLPIFSP